MKTEEIQLRNEAIRTDAPPLLREIPEAQARSLHVLVVDDEPGVREVLIQYLRLDGHTVATATNGREGLERFFEDRYDAVVTDYAMPELFGDKLAAAIKQASPLTPVILLTGFGNLMQGAGTRSAGPDVVLSKPIRLSTFRENVASVVGSALRA